MAARPINDPVAAGLVQHAQGVFGCGDVAVADHRDG